MSVSPPKFYKELQDFTASQGGCTVLECRLKASPPAKVMWMREGDVIEDSPDFRILHKGEISTLVISTAYPEDSGEFQCVATNSAGSAISSCVLTVTGENYSVSTKAPAATNHIALDKPKVKSAVQSDLEDIGQPHPSAGRTEHAQNNTVFIGESVEEEDSTPFVLAPVETTSTMLHSPPPPRDALMDSNHNFKLEKDTLVHDLAKKLSTSDPSSPTANDQGYRLSNFEQRLVNEIEYRLKHTTPVNEDPQDAVFESVPSHEQRSPTFTLTLASYKIAVGSPIQLMCKVAGSPKPKVYWFKDEKQISKRSQHYLTSQEEDGVYVLYIPRTCVEDDGNYTVLALNPNGRCCCTGRLAVVTSRNPSESHPQPQRSPARVQAKGTLAEDEESAVEKYFKPVFVQKTGDVEVDEGKLARLDVKVTGLPSPDLQWLINGHAVGQDQHHRIIVRENNVHSLLIQPVNGMDEGRYTVVATNKAGRATADIQLQVKPKEQTSVPVFVQRLTPQVAAEGGSVRLEARVIGKPQPAICWKRGSEQVTNTMTTQIIQDDTGYVCLLINEATRRDSDWYTCSATNKAGIASCNCKLDVYSPTTDAPHQRRRIRTPNRYASLAKTAGIDMREAISPDIHSFSPSQLPESDDL